ncbi:NlpC/P60 family protein [Branchiibius hedensis]|uniref:NlpC/P60 family protein n=1 Tax=Branchiibius hedensis TaxID=672460 RepID=A0A2Y9BPF5_9MICO|nr:peptidoglycan DD-metalloendopeptidase family protein [Branchiibius hedensis]PWJ23271.1 NlpC/P60 family protein [Branchiibius hedensis]SSA58960.1 NlpC/P60 family protein [Branchiibius hedensis]
MKKLVVGLTMVLAILTAVPLLAAFMVVVVASPAAGEELKAQDCQGGSTVATGPWRVPTAQKYTITSGFGPRMSPGGIGSTNHQGVDLAMLPQPGSVLAASAGKVKVAGPYGGLGNAVVLDNGSGITTVYGHMAQLDPAMKVGATVTLGQRLGLEGSTGNSTGNHLHFGVAINGTFTDPIPFMTQHGAPLNGQAVAPTPPPAKTPSVGPPTPPPWKSPLGGKSPTDPGVPVKDPGGEGGIGFPLPAPGEPRKDSLHNPPLSIPDAIKADYVRAANKYKIPWTLLAGIGMEETGHGRNNHSSSAGAQGLMQFMPATWATYGVDGDGDGKAIITNDADSAMSAANYLTASGVTKGEAGVKRAIFAYNHASWYVNDVLYYAAKYGGGEVLGDPTDCGTGVGDGNPQLPPLTNERVKKLLTWAEGHLGDGYVMGANGPNTWDCSSFSSAAYRQLGITMPRTAGAQQAWLAAGNGFRVSPGDAKPGDLIFYDSYLGPNVIGHVEMVFDPAKHQAIGAQSPKIGVTMSDYSYNMKTKHIFEIWRVGNISDKGKKTM